MSRKKKLDDLMEAITFAEAGETGVAREIASEIFPDPAAGERILAISGPSGFSRRMIENGVAMAERLGYGVVAVSVQPAFARLVANLGGGARGRSASRSVEAFRARAAERGVPFAHAVRSGDPERAVADVRRRFRRIAFLLVEPELTSKRRFAAVNLPIFYLADA
jgi:hypothetical protein